MAKETTPPIPPETLVDPRFLKPRLIWVSLFVTTYELLVSATIGRIEEFFTSGFDENGMTTDPQYQESLAKTGKKGRLAQSLAWLEDMKALTSNDVSKFNEVRAYRNKLVHELPNLVGTFDAETETKTLASAMALLRKIEVWWVQNVEIPINPDYDGQVIEDADINPGRVMFIQMIGDIALSEGEEAEKYLAEFKKRKSKT